MGLSRVSVAQWHGDGSVVRPEMGVTGGAPWSGTYGPPCDRGNPPLAGAWNAGVIRSPGEAPTGGPTAGTASTQKTDPVRGAPNA